jgi:FkbM family methyltransferase
VNSGLIYDVGLHKGEDSEFYLSKGFSVVAIEAAPELCELTSSRLRCYLKTGQLIILNKAIAAQKGPTSLFVSKEFSEWSTTKRSWAEWYLETKKGLFTEITVPGVPFAEVLAEFGVPYYLKVDIEGADILCLRALQQCRSRPRFVSIESARTSWKELNNEMSLFQSLGYSKFKPVQQLEVPAQRCPFPAREGRFVEHRFQSGASGLFGRELPGRWLSLRQVRAAYRYVFLRRELFGETSFLRNYRVGRSALARLGFRVGWYDTHASL